MSVPVTLEILGAQSALSEHQSAIQNREELGYRLLSLGVGYAGGLAANFVLFNQADAGIPTDLVRLEELSPTLNRDEQQAALNGFGVTVVCYGSLSVDGRLRNVVALR